MHFAGKFPAIDLFKYSVPEKLTLGRDGSLFYLWLFKKREFRLGILEKKVPLKKRMKMQGKVDKGAGVGRFKKFWVLHICLLSFSIEKSSR
jgi:hypothetical protein